MPEQKFLWYMISTVVGKEDQVLESLKNRIISEQVDQSFNQEATPEGPFKVFKKPTLTSKELEKKRAGEPYKVKYVNMYSGYIFINMEMTDEAWFVVRNTQYVTGLIGSSGKGAKPTPVSLSEINKCFESEKKLQSDFDAGVNATKFAVGEVVEITDGPFKGSEGKILESNDGLKVAVVEIEYFGKKVPTEFKYEVVKSQER